MGSLLVKMIPSKDRKNYWWVARWHRKWWHFTTTAFTRTLMTCLISDGNSFQTHSQFTLRSSTAREPLPGSEQKSPSLGHLRWPKHDEFSIFISFRPSEFFCPSREFFPVVCENFCDLTATHSREEKEKKAQEVEIWLAFEDYMTSWCVLFRDFLDFPQHLLLL